MTDTIPALEQYKLEKDPREQKIEQLTALQKDSSKGLTLGKAEQEKLKQRFSKNELTGDINPYAITLALAFLDHNDKKCDGGCGGNCFQNNIRTAWTKLSDDSLELADFAKTTLSDVIWQRADCYQLLLFIYGAERIDFIERAWQDMPTRSFQQGWERRSFRISADNTVYFDHRIDLLQESSRACSEGWGDEYYDLPKLEKVRWAWNLYRTNSPFEWSAELDMAGEAGTLEENEMFQLMADIIYNRDDTTRGVTPNHFRGVG